MLLFPGLAPLVQMNWMVSGRGLVSVAVVPGEASAWAQSAVLRYETPVRRVCVEILAVERVQIGY